MNCFCTIITSDYLPYARAIHDNLLKFHQAKNFSVLVVDKNEVNKSKFNTYKVSSLKDFAESDYDKIAKYREDIESSYRWALKPLFIKFLIKKIGFEKVIYIDPDIFFYRDPGILLDSLNENDILITPHWRSKDPFEDKANFDLLFSGGLYNAGFFACNNQAVKILDWWLTLCSYKMEMHKGFYVDQAYLNLLPIYFSKQVKIIEHKGCNVAGWNQLECKRMEKDGEVLIEGEYPVIFIHFTQGTINNILSGKDYLLAHHLQIYKESIRRYLPEFEIGLSEKSEIVNKSKFMRLLKNIKLKH